MSRGFYCPGDGFFHRLHPVTKIVVLFLSFISAMALDHPLWVLLLFMVYALLGARTGAMKNAGRVAVILVLVAVASFGIWSFSYEGGTEVFRLGPLSVTREGMLFGAGMGLRLDLMVFCGLIFLAVTPVEELTHGLTRLGVPFPVGFALSLSFRLAPLFSDTVGSILDAQRARGLIVKGGPISRLRLYVPLFVPVFAGALRRTDQLAAALESKGFGLGVKRGSLVDYRAGYRDVVSLIVVTAIIIALIAVRLLGWGMVAG